MGIIKIFEDIVHSIIPGEEEEEPDERSLKLDGPFLPEDVALKHIKAYQKCLKETFYNINCSINRSILILSDDISFHTRDNNRVELGISPYKHSIGLHIYNSSIDVFELDRNILLNPKDREKIKNALKNFPITKEEIKNIF